MSLADTYAIGMVLHVLSLCTDKPYSANQRSGLRLHWVARRKDVQNVIFNVRHAS
jgi:hypothetical protein